MKTPSAPNEIVGTSSLVLVTSLIFASGNPAFSGTTVTPIICIAMVFVALWMERWRLQHKKIFLRRAILLSTAFLAIFLAHHFILGFASVPASTYFLAKLLAGGVVIHQLGPRFVPALLRATYWLSVSSLVGYGVLLAVGPEAFPNLLPDEYLGENLKSIFVFTVVTTEEWWRNSGPMWEPGAFQGIINLALFLAPAGALTSPKQRLKTLTMAIALVTTFSTTGYVVFFMVLIYKLTRSHFSLAAKTFMSLLLLASATYVAFEADFLGEKIVSQYGHAVEAADFTPDRFGAFVFDLHYIAKNPVFGNGFHEVTRFADHPHLHGLSLGHGNGLSNFTASVGILGITLYLLFLSRSAVGTSTIDRVALVAVVILLAFGEQFLVLPLFLGLPFLTTAQRPSTPRSLQVVRRAQV